MSITPQNRRRRYSPPPAVLAVLVCELIAAAVLLIIGVPWLSLLAYGGPLIGFTLALLSPTVQELGRRQPRLTVAARDDEGRVVVAPGARPWPVDISRVVANEVDDARETMNRPAVLDNFMSLTGPFPIRPSEAQKQRAKAAFEERVEKFESELRDWLTDYADAARAYADTFDLTLLLRNAASGAYAEAVTVVLDLPDSVEVVEDLPNLPPPPDRPFYEPPRNQSISPDPAISRFPAVHGLARVIAEQTEPIRFPMEPIWKISDDGREMEASVGDVHPGRSTAVGEPLLLRASGPGRHVLRWAAFSKSARKEASGTISLELPPDPPRPAFGRLNGIRRYPDVPFVDEEGEVVAEVRNSDPPLGPELDGEDEGEGPLKTIREARAFAEWQALGLDPAHDGPERYTVGEAKQA